MDDVTFDDDIGSMEVKGSRVSVSSGRAVDRRVVIKYFESSEASDYKEGGEEGEEGEYRQSLETAKKLRYLFLTLVRRG